LNCLQQIRKNAFEIFKHVSFRFVSFRSGEKQMGIFRAEELEKKEEYIEKPILKYSQQFA